MQDSRDLTRVTLALVAAAAAVLSACGASATSSISSDTGRSPSSLPASLTGPGGCRVSTPTDGQRYDTGIAFVVCYSATGGLTSSGGFFDQDSSHASCKDWAAKGQQTSVIGIDTSDRVELTRSLPAPDPSGSAALIVSGGELNPELALGPYSGPGTFTRSDISQGVALRDPSSGKTLHSWDDIGVSHLDFNVTVNPDGSGTAAVNGLVDNSHGGTSLSYTEQWRCMANGR